MTRAALKSLAFAVASMSMACAQAAPFNRPFAVGGGEGGGGAVGGITGWLLNAQSHLTHLMSSHLRELAADPNVIWGLMSLGFAYGVFHAAGPGHGKAIVASYMLANDRALKRGIVLAFLAAALQGVVAIVLVAVGAYLFRATSSSLNRVADGLTVASYAGVALMGAWLVWKKGSALVATLRKRGWFKQAIASSAVIAGAQWSPNANLTPSMRFRAVSPEGDSAIDPECGHQHILDPGALDVGFSWRAAAATVIAAGSRPCSGAILVLVFSLAQNLFYAGIAATLAMSLGTALTTGALAVLAVFAKDIAIRFAGDEGARAELVGRALEFLAALLVLALGLALFWEARSGA